MAIKKTFITQFNLISFLLSQIGVIGLFLLLTPAHSLAGVTPSDLFFDNPSPDQVTVKTKPSKRKRFIKIRDEAFLDKHKFLKPGPLSDFKLNLFDDASYTFVLEKPKFLPDGVILTGHLLEAPGSFALLTYENGILVGDFFILSKGNFQIRYAGEGIHRVIEVDTTKELQPTEPDDISPPPGSIPVPNQPPANDPIWYPNCTYANNPYIIDLMVVYTPQVLADYGGSISAVQALINQAVAYTNQSFVNSNILAELRVVRVEPVTYTESGSMYTDIYRLQNPSDGYMDNVPIDRNTYGADLVCLLESPPPLSAIAGLGFYSVTNGNAYPDYGYSVIEDSSNPQVMAHELGHNLGCNHDAANAAGIAAYSYSYGWRFTASGDTYICNMGYPPGGVIPYYSSPLVNYLGVPTGTSTADNARTINNTAPIVAGYRSTVMTNAYPDVNITSPTNGYIEYRPTPVTIMANASDSDGTIQQVDFYSDNNYLGTITNSPYNFPTVLNPGSHLLTAWATDNGGALRISCAVSIQVKSSLPSPWTENDIGMSQGPGFSSYNGVTMTLTGTGSDLTNSGNNDNFYFVSQTFCGDGSIIARLLDASSSPTADTEPGLMMREDLSPGAQYMGIDLFYNPYSPPVDPFYSWRTPAGSTVNWGGGVTFNLPYWTKIQRIGNIFNTYYSPDGVTWTSYSGPKTINMQQTIQAGLFIDNSNGGSPGAPVTAHFDNISVSMACAPPTSTNTPTNSPTLTPTKTPTNTPTLTPTNSPTGIWYTSTPTKTPTNNPTNTSTPTIVETIQGDTFPTFTPTPTNSFTPTNTPTLTDTYTPTLTATQTPTSTLTVTPTLTWTLTPTFTPTATDTPCLVFGNTCTPSLTPTPTLDPSELIYNHRPYPNPAGNQTTFYYQLSKPVDLVTFKLFTVAYRKVAQFQGTNNGGDNNVPFDLTGFANGLYFYVIDASAGGKTERKIGKLIISR